MTTIKKGQILKHHSGRLYEVLHIANDAHPSDKFPVTVVYKGLINGEVWARDISEFTADKFTILFKHKQEMFDLFMVDHYK